jgi:hypothetical protein
MIAASAGAAREPAAQGRNFVLILSSQAMRVPEDLQRADTYYIGTGSAPLQPFFCAS